MKLALQTIQLAVLFGGLTAEEQAHLQRFASIGLESPGGERIAAAR